MENKEIFQNHYYNTYYYSNIIDNILTGKMDFIGFISSFKELYSSDIIHPFKKRTTLHLFIEHIVREFFLDDMFNYDEEEFKYYQNSPPLRKLYAESAFLAFEIDCPFSPEDDSNITWKEIELYHQELQHYGYAEVLFEKMAKEIFHIIFNHRELLLRFNYFMSNHVEEVFLSLDNFDEKTSSFFKENGSLKRKNIPKWVKRAVFFRDKGRCCNCSKDLSGSLSLLSKENYDHICQC
jgi:hypothetical protein